MSWRCSRRSWRSRSWRRSSWSRLHEERRRQPVGCCEVCRPDPTRPLPFPGVGGRWRWRAAHFLAAHHDRAVRRRRHPRARRTPERPATTDEALVDVGARRPCLCGLVERRAHRVRRCPRGRWRSRRRCRRRRRRAVAGRRPRVRGLVPDGSLYFERARRYETAFCPSPSSARSCCHQWRPCRGGGDALAGVPQRRCGEAQLRYEARRVAAGDRVWFRSGSHLIWPASGSVALQQECGGAGDLRGGEGGAVRHDVPARCGRVGAE